MMVEDYSFEEGFMTDGSVVIFPTDTVYGLAARLYDMDAYKKIEAIKTDKPIKYAILCDTLVSVNDLVVIDERAKKLMMAFWPGALTIILKSSRSHYEKTGQKTIGVRIPNHNAAVRLIKKNGPLLTTSVSIDDEPLLTMDEIKKHYQTKVDYIYEEYNAYYLNVTSTTIDLSEPTIKYLRIGSISKQDIESVIGQDFQI
ncbi:MAG: L-threonylcarbamoyladenylate synthase [Acholeplasma sp.]|jgi:L-threonylcarbamoyladenylate synthase|nr:L-threonylcarbamoyladenylate synthase [Acholeplasma sp.]